MHPQTTEESAYHPSTETTGMDEVGRRDFHTAIVVHKCVYGLAPEYLTSTLR